MTSKKGMEVVALQLQSQKRYKANLELLLQLLDEHSDKELIVAPEVVLTAYDYEHIDTAAKFSRKALKILKKRVDKQIVVVTLILKDGENYINQAVVIHKHKVVHRQNKVKLFRLGDEHKYLQAGEQETIKPFEIDGVKYALLICFELRFKDLWKQIEGVDIILIPARWGLPRKGHLEILSKALAVMNQAYVILSNSSDADMASSSAIISPQGEAVMDDSKLALSGRVDFREIKKIRRYIVID